MSKLSIPQRRALEWLSNGGKIVLHSGTRASLIRLGLVDWNFASMYAPVAPGRFASFGA